MYKMYVRNFFYYIGVIIFLVILTHFTILIVWFFSKIFNVFTSYTTQFDYLSYGNGCYHNDWFWNYISSFNIFYAIYIIFGCWDAFLDCNILAFKCIFFFDDYIWQYSLSEYKLKQQWQNIQWNNTALFNFNLIKTAQNLFGNFLFTFKNFGGAYLCPVQLFRNIITVDFFIYYNEQNTLMVLFGCLFFLSSVLSLFMLSYLGLYGVFIVNLITIVIFWLSVLSRMSFFFFKGGVFKINFGKWFTLWGHMVIPFELYIDSISYAYILLTLTIAVFVFIYVFSYFRYEPNVERLLLFINFFVISMILLVSSGNFFVLFLGWELIGLTSFFLINFWSTRIATLKAAFKAYVFNKFSDVSLFIAIMLSIMLISDTNIAVFNNQIHLYSNYVLHVGSTEISYIELISFFFLMSAFIKSAQFGAHIWLPDSMEAPAPASALIHSATLVSAGVFLVLRFAPLFEVSLYAYTVLAIVGSFTAFFGGFCSVYQSDVKRILAYSTISHCGFLMVTCVTRVPELTIFYLYVHGFFKAAVFLCIGNIIRFSYNYQDFKKMGGYWKYLPFECICSLICLMNLAGLPFTLGFYIKHIMLAFLPKDLFIYYIMFGFIIVGALAGLFYSYRLYYYVFFDFKKGKKYIYNHANRMELKSIFYSNTTLASNIAISSLIFVGYTISIYLFFLIFTKLPYSDAFDVVSIHSSSYYNLNWSVKTFLNFLASFNWLVLQLIVILIYSVWRYIYNFSSVLSTLFSVIIFFIFFYLNFLFFSI